jgi:hypothetical protein
MKKEEFFDFQYEYGHSALSGLLRDCIRRFLAAARLVELDGPVFKTMREAEHKGHVDIAPLYPAWEAICKRYLRERFDEQAGLFQDHRAESIERWGQFIYWELFPVVLLDDEFVRNVLRAAGLLPCTSKYRAAAALSNHLQEMNLPFSRPIWEPALTE